MLGRVLCSIGCTAAFATLGHAQLIGIKTAPVAQGDQLGFLPSANMGMGGVSIAIPDTLRDAFLNPAKAARLKRGYVFGSPTFFSVSGGGGGGRTLPIGTLFRSGSFFGGAALALQEISPPNQNEVFTSAELILPPQAGLSADFPRSRSRTNRYAYATLGRTLGDGRTSIATSAFFSGLNVVDGVDVMYTGNAGLRQSGQSFDYRVALLKELGDNQSLEALLVYNRFGMSHDVGFIDQFWDPGLRQPVPSARTEHNSDRYSTLGLHLEYERPLADSGWRVGGLFTANRIVQPTRPNYTAIALPRDPGTTMAYNVGMGLARSDARGAAALDLIYEPIWSNTLAVAGEAVETHPGIFIPPGGRTLENNYRFHNAIARAGLSRDFKIDPENSVVLQLGMQLRSISYSLAQRDFAAGIDRRQRDSWNEWSRTWGVGLRGRTLDVRYAWRSLSGNGRPGFEFRSIPGLDVTSSSVAPAPISVAPVPFFPSQERVLRSVRVASHQFTVTVPIR